MSFLAFKQSLLADVALITWTNPPTAPSYLPTKFGRIDDQQWADQVGADEFPLCRIHIPELVDHKETMGTDHSGSLWQQRGPVHLFLYNAGYGSDAQGLGDYFDNMVDSVLAYFRLNTSPQPGGVATVANDHLVARGLRTRSKIELPERIDDALHYRGTVSLDLLGYIT